MPRTAATLSPFNYNLGILNKGMTLRDLLGSKRRPLVKGYHGLRERQRILQRIGQ